MKKRILSGLVLVMAAGLSLTACGKTDTADQEKPAVQSSSNTDDADDSGAGSSQADNASDKGFYASALIPGKLEYVNLEEGEKPVIAGVSIAGNQVGSTEFNTYDPTTNDIRCIFQLNEWVEFYLDADSPDGIKVWALKHHSDDSFDYTKEKISDSIPEYVGGCDLTKEEEGGCWGSFYLNPDEVPAGLYDLAFTYKGKTVALMITRFYDPGVLEQKNDDELRKMMKSEVTP